MKVMYVPWGKALRMCYMLAAKILKSNEYFDTIVTVSRGGLIPARIVSDVIGVDDLYTIRSKLWGIGGKLYDEPLLESYERIPLRGRSVLVVDEVVDTGATLSKVLRLVRDLGASKVRTAVLHYKLTSSVRPDYYVEEIREWVWIFYPWSFSETLYSLARGKGGDAVEAAIRLANTLGAELDMLGVESLRLSLREYVRRYG